MNIQQFFENKISDLELKNIYKQFETAEDYADLGKDSNALLTTIKEGITNGKIEYNGEYSYENLYSDLTIEAARRYVHGAPDALKKIMFG